MSKSELLPCPLCRSDARLVRPITTGLYGVECNNYKCGCRITAQHAFDTLAIDAWNRRPDVTLLEEQYNHALRLVEELSEVLSLNGGGVPR